MVYVAQSVLMALPRLSRLVVSALVSLATAIVNFMAASAAALFSRVEGPENNEKPTNNQGNNNNPNNPNKHLAAFVSLEAARAFERLADPTPPDPDPEAGVLSLEAVVA
jgi:hypothetical protein